MVSNRQMLGFMQIAEKLDVNRIVMVGDSGQIGAVEAGSPFRQLQEKALPTLHLDENLRQRDSEMKEAVSLLQAGYVQDAFDKSGNRIVENADPASSATKAWLSLDDKARANTSIFTSGHRLRTEMLDTLRGALAKEGKLGATEISLPVLVNRNLTREQMRSVSSYEKGHVLDVYRDTAAIGLRRGSYDVIAVDPNNREVRCSLVAMSIASGQNGCIPMRQACRYPSQIKFPCGPGICCTGQLATLRVALAAARQSRIRGMKTEGSASWTVKASQSRWTPTTPWPSESTTPCSQLHKAQGITVENAITVMQSGDRMLNNQSLAYVLTSRAREGFELHLDSRDAIIEQLEGNNGMQHSAMDVADSAKGRNEAEKVNGPAVESAMERATPQSWHSKPLNWKRHAISILASKTT